MALKKDEYYQLTNLYLKQEWLISKKMELNELVNLCEDRDSKDVVFSLLERFSYLNTEKLNFILNEVSEYIINDTGFVENTTQLLALSWDEEADSGQKILDYIKHPIFKKGWYDLKTVNIFSKVMKNINEGRTQIIIIDEFIGSGKTLRSRLKYLKSNIKVPYEVKCCFLAGMKNTIDLLTDEGEDIFCPIQLEKGITEHFKGEELLKAKSIMLELELKLAQSIKNKNLYDYSFGYGGAEALYSLEGASGNTPNSVFPIFWWLRDKNDILRNTLLTRFERGF